MDPSSVNYLAVLVAAVAAFIIGFLWHGPVFGKTWIKLMKITQAEIQKGQKEMAKKMPLYMLAALVQQMVVAFVVSMIASVAGVTDAMGAFVLAFWLWLGFIATVLLNGVLWEKRSVNLYAFNVVYQLVSLVVVTLIVVLMK